MHYFDRNLAVCLVAVIAVSVAVLCTKRCWVGCIMQGKCRDIGALRFVFLGPEWLLYTSRWRVLLSIGRLGGGWCREGGIKGRVILALDRRLNHPTGRLAVYSKGP